MHCRNMDETSSDTTLNADISPNVIDFVPEVQASSLIQDKLQINNLLDDRTSMWGVKILFALLLIIASTIFAELIVSGISLGFYRIDEMKGSSTDNKLQNIPDTNCFNMELINHLNDKVSILNKKIEYLNQELNNIVKWRRGLKSQLHKLQVTYQLFANLNASIESALELYDADKLGMSDYALESAGGIITAIPNTIPHDTRYAYDILGIVNIYPRSNPRMLIQPGILPGECFAFAGSIGWIRIMLVHTIQITAVTMEHTYTNLVGDMSSAPKDFNVYGLENKYSDRGDFLGSFVYNINGKPLQTFQVDTTNNKTYNNVELHIKSNHGNALYTCIYRFRVHGNRK